MSTRASQRIMERIVAGICLAFAFLVMASVFSPDSTRAGDHATTHPMTSVDPHEGLRPLGSLQDSRYIVTIFGTDDEPLFSVYDASDGSELGLLLTEERAMERFPDLPLSTMNIDDAIQRDGPLMLAPSDQGWSH